MLPTQPGVSVKTPFASGFSFLPKEGGAATGSRLGEVGAPRPQETLGEAYSILVTNAWLAPSQDSPLLISLTLLRSLWPSLSHLSCLSPCIHSLESQPPGQGLGGNQANKNQSTDGSLVFGDWDRALS